MSLETRHTEKNMLFLLRQVERNQLPIANAIAQLTATMEPEDVKLVEQALNELDDRRGDKK